MRRVAMCVSVLLAAAVPVWGGPASAATLFPSDASQINGTAGRSIDLSAYNALREGSSTRQQDEPFVARPAEDAVPGAGGGLTLGPLQTEFERTTGKHSHLATFRLQGVRVFGAAVGGSVDGRSANVLFSWPTSP